MGVKVAGGMWREGDGGHIVLCSPYLGGKWGWVKIICGGGRGS